MKCSIITLFIFTHFSVAYCACNTALTIQTDDTIYPGIGEVQVCTNSANELEKLKIIKPVHNPSDPNPNSVQYDERNPIMNISINEINSNEDGIVIMRPRRLRTEIEAASIKRFGDTLIDIKKGGTVKLLVLKSKLMSTYHPLILSLKNIGGIWETTIRRGHEAEWSSVKGLFFETGIDGIKRIDIE